MRTLYLLALIYIGFALTSCSTLGVSKNNRTQSAVSISPLKTCAITQKKKNPLAVSFYTTSQPKFAYKILGEEKISKYNKGGNKRQEALIRDGMRELAAAMGGDAVINLKNNAKSISGTVIAFQKSNDETNKSET